MSTVEAVANNFIVRKATRDDLDWLISQLKSFSTFFTSKRQLFEDESFARSAMLSIIESHFVLVCEQGSERAGFIAGLISPHLFNPNIRMLTEVFWWVNEAHRGTRAGLLLLNEFIKWGKANADWISMALETHSPVKDKAILKRGFHLQERSFLLEVI